MTEIFNKTEQKEKRRDLRKQQTLGELIFWAHVKNRKLGGFKFRRQYSINKYVADFYCSELLLVVEIDGGQHYEEENKKKDALRTEYFTGLGLDVKRYTNIDIKNNLNGTLDDLLEYCNELKKKPH